MSRHMLDVQNDAFNKTHRDAAEKQHLCESPIACAVADAWVEAIDGRTIIHSRFGIALDALELATRESPLRKIKP